jgi:hypothetical protein
MVLMKSSQEKLVATNNIYNYFKIFAFLILSLILIWILFYIFVSVIAESWLVNASILFSLGAALLVLVILLRNIVLEIRNLRRK